MKINFLKLEHIQLAIPEGKENEARKFYKDILGLEEIPKPAELCSSGGLWFKAADIELHLGTGNYSINPKQHPAFEIYELDKVRKHLETFNIKIKDEIQIPGRKRFSFFDPFGNRIELFEFI